MATPHINAQPGDFAETVLMPGDPLRAKMIAETFLEDAKLVTTVRNVFGYTGTYQGKRLSVMAHGMGIPSASIYTTELIKDYGVKNIIRIGSCGAVTSDIKLRELFVAMGASTDSKVNRMRFNDHDYAAIADYGLLRTVVDAAAEQGKPVTVGNVFSADLFYGVQPNMLEVLDKMQVKVIEMELAGIYSVAAQYGARAVGILTVSDIIPTGEATSAEERQTTFRDMMEVALAAAIKL
ncbi:purine-nucleoside phosphorylase [Chromobacterium alkanivorans]|uniref:purine-nucleoside phosphorylase n=1 Tax=Chromobacterium alkanivorans TaxID=1071719 RepID=UPI00216A3EB8|nr:purine-nucleoside phosphorylase [Chromobacterium alkanivorans]MCS3805103.1 purine-nucleoside phosphorylase [Chromobacterium alkanivorans]MCS3819334.1 purine-nucleoside phosphorylase [Chromobacterium alkanivorans]MCS3873846.1 purine-nucleoside phosphorylase [Chromobacterium alkanivorans]